MPAVAVFGDPFSLVTPLARTSAWFRFRFGLQLLCAYSRAMELPGCGMLTVVKRRMPKLRWIVVLALQVNGGLHAFAGSDTVWVLNHGFRRFRSNSCMTKPTKKMNPRMRK